MYQIVPDPITFDQVAALPADAADAYFDVLNVLTLTPWNGVSQNSENPDAEVRRWHFGPDMAAHVLYLILEEQQEVHILMVQWLG